MPTFKVGDRVLVNWLTGIHVITEVLDPDGLYVVSQTNLVDTGAEASDDEMTLLPEGWSG